MPSRVDRPSVFFFLFFKNKYKPSSSFIHLRIKRKGWKEKKERKYLKTTNPPTPPKEKRKPIATLNTGTKTLKFNVKASLSPETYVIFIQ